MKVTYWGTRGSIAVPGEKTVTYGGNTSCLSVELGDTVLIFDAGTGIRECGTYLLSKYKPVKGTIFISHTHWDHIQGFPFFVPSFIPGNAFTMYGPPSDVQNLSLRKIMEHQTNYEYFPIRIDQLGASIDYVDCREEKIEGDGFEVHTCRLNHPVTCLAYKVIHNGKTFVYGGDHEPFRNLYRDSADVEEMDEDLLAELDSDADAQNGKIAEFCRDADLVSWDAQYSEEEYQSKKGWGHSWYEFNLAFAQRARIKHIVFTHHDPAKDDATLGSLEKHYAGIAREKGFKLDFAREGMSIEM